MAENNEPPAEGDAKPSESIPPTQRRIFGTKRLASEPTPPARPDLEEKLANLVDSVKVLQSHITTGAPLAEPPSDAEAKARRTRRFQRAGGEEAPEPSPEAAEAAPLDHEIRGDEATLNKNIAWPRLARPADAPPAGAKPGPSGASPRRYMTAIWVVAYATGFGLLALGFLLGQSSGGTDENNPPSEPAAHATPAPDILTRAGINDRALAAVNSALAAEKSGDVAGARTAYEAAVNGAVHLPGAEYRLAMLDLRRRDFTGADIHLQHSLAQGEMMAQCYFVDAFFACHNQADYAAAAAQFAQAVRVEPFNAKYYFCWGEALRRAGKTREAVDAITQALNRPAPPRDQELFSFKLRLAKVEGGHDDALNTELAGRLAKGETDGDWLLLAAAQDLAKGAFSAAAEHLRAAARALPPEVYRMRVLDYAFQGYAGQQDVTASIKVPLPNYPLDPDALPAEAADPAVWPPFAPMR